MNNPYDKEHMQKAGLIWMAFFLALVVAFVVLKLIAVITWGWIWIFAPLWIPMLIGTIMSLLGITPPE